MTVAQLIALLEKYPKHWTVYSRDFEGDFDTVSAVDSVMMQEFVWDGEHRVLKSINAVKLDTY